MMTWLGRLRRDERGVSAVEFALLLPVLILLLVGTVTIFDLFRTAQAAEKGTFTVGDMLSRQTTISQTILKSMVVFIENTVENNGKVRLRVSSIANTGGKLTLEWSKDEGDKSIAMAAINYAIVPAIAVGDSVILTETFIPHASFATEFGVDRLTYTNAAANRPRFVGKIAYQ